MFSFRENAAAFASVNAIRIAMLRLSMAGYRIVKFTAVSGPAIQIDRPLEGEETKPVEQGGRSFAFCEFGGCRVYWQVGQ